VVDFTADLGEYRVALNSAGLGRYADALVRAARPSVRLDAAPRLDTALPGVSRLGGHPDLPAEVEWPTTRNAVPLSFIAQVNLADVSAYDVEQALPAGGLLSFFYDAASQSAWGFDPADQGSWAVHYSHPGRTVEPRAFPAGLPREGRFSAVGLTPRAELTFVGWESPLVEQLGMTRDERLALAGLERSEDGTTHRLLGHADPIQGDMQLECQLVSNGLYCGDARGYHDPRAGALRAGAADWRLLLQVDTEDAIGMMWGDVGRIYYWMRSQDLVARRWQLSWLILQCT
jgi:uncharacterized protein YwqG